MFRDYAARYRNGRTHYIRGLTKRKTRVGLALAVMMAPALGQVRAMRSGMRSLAGVARLRDIDCPFIRLPCSQIDLACRRQTALCGDPCDHVPVLYPARNRRILLAR